MHIPVIIFTLLFLPASIFNRVPLLCLSYTTDNDSYIAVETLGLSDHTWLVNFDYKNQSEKKKWMCKKYNCIEIESHLHVCYSL